MMMNTTPVPDSHASDFPSDGAPIARVGLCLDCLAAVGCAGAGNVACALFDASAGWTPEQGATWQQF